MKSVCFFLASVLVSVPAFAGWMANADFTSCPRNRIPETSGSEGPFSSESDCLARIRQVESQSPLACARYSCNEQGGSGAGATATSAAPGHEMDGEIGKAISAGVQGKISAGDTVGLVSMGLLGNAILAPGTPEQPKTPAQIEAEKIAAEKAALERERRQREREAKKDESVAPMIALLDPVPSGETPVHPVGYDKGYEHASQCISQNSGPACAGEKESCISDYRAGYEAGVKDKAIRLEEALQAGLAAGKSGGLADGGADSRASGPCRVEWIESYNRGYFQGKHSKAGK